MRVFVTPCTSRDYETVAATLRRAGHAARGRSRAGGFLHDLEQDTRTLLESDFVVALRRTAPTVWTPLSPRACRPSPTPEA